MNPTGITIANAFANFWIFAEYLLFTPTDWNEDANPCNKCNAKNTKQIQ